MRQYKTKCPTLTKVEDVDRKKGIVIFYASVFNNKDSDGDIIIKGAFKRSLDNGFERLRHMKDHRIVVGLPIKKETYETDIGLRVGSQLFMKDDESTQDAKELFIQMETYADLGNAMESSIGYEEIKDKIFYDEEKQANIIKEIKLWEVTSMTTWGANSMARQVGLKNMSHNDLIRELEVLKRMVGSDFKDARLKEYEEQIKIVENMIDSSTPVQDSDTQPHNNDKKKELLIKILGYGI